MTDEKPKSEILTKLQLAGCIIRNPENEILLIHRNTPARVQWEVPGGKIGDHIEGEKPEETVLREVAEELGIEIKVLGKAGVHEFSEDGHAMDYTWYNAVIVSGEAQPVEEGHDRVGYFSWDKLNLMREELSPNLRNLVDAFFAGQLNLAQGNTV